MLYEGNKSYYPLIPIGQNITVGPDQADTIGCICVSPSGRIAIVEQDPAITGEPEDQFLSRVTRCSDYIRNFGWSKLNEISEDYYYQTEGQAFRIIDIMARAGLLQFADEGLLSVKLDRGLGTEQHLVVISTNDSKSRRKDFSCGKFAGSHLCFSFIDGSLPFLPK